MSEQSQNKLCSCKLLGLQQSVGLGLAPPEQRGELSLWPPSSHRLSREGVLCPAGNTVDAGSCNGQGDTNQGTSPSHSSASPAQAPVSIKPKPLLHILGCKQASILSTSVSYAGRCQNYIESSLKGKSCLQCLLTFKVFSHKQTPQKPSSKNNAT